MPTTRLHRTLLTTVVCLVCLALVSPALARPARVDAALTQQAGGVSLTVTVSSAFARAAPVWQATRTASVFAGDHYPINARSADNTWVRLSIPGVAAATWLHVSYGSVSGSLASVPLGQAAAPAQSAAPPTSRPPVAAAKPAPVTHGGDIDVASVVSNSGTARVQQIYASGVALGNNRYRFIKVGDSNMASGGFLTPFDYGDYNLGAYRYLQPAIGHFYGSFSRVSAAAINGMDTAQVTTPGFSPHATCDPQESPLQCELRLAKPAVALIMLGTNDRYYWWEFEGRYRKVIEEVMAAGTIPVLFTKPDDAETGTDTYTPALGGLINNQIRAFAAEYQLPLVDTRLLIEPLHRHGLDEQWLHFNVPPDRQVSVFDDTHLAYGYNVVNLAALQVLWQLHRDVLR